MIEVKEDKMLKLEVEVKECFLNALILMSCVCLKGEFS